MGHTTDATLRRSFHEWSAIEIERSYNYALYSIEQNDIALHRTIWILGSLAPPHVVPTHTGYDIACLEWALEDAVPPL